MKLKLKLEKSLIISFLKDGISIKLFWDILFLCILLELFGFSIKIFPDSKIIRNKNDNLIKG